MKAAAFDYQRPATLDEAVALLAEHGDDARLLAGGQSLVPSMSFRLARPAVIVDINRIDGLGRVDRAPGRWTIGALARHAQFDEPPRGSPLGDLLSAAAAHIGHVPIRVAGTFGGSVAHADPAAEWCVVAALLDAQIEVRSTRGSRSIPAGEFFRGPFTTALDPDEVVTAVVLPEPPSSARVAFQEFSRRRGDFALAIAAVVIDVSDGRVADARIALGGVAGTPVRCRDAEALLRGSALDDMPARDAAEAAAREAPVVGDVHGDEEFRRDLIRALVRRSIGRHDG